MIDQVTAYFKDKDLKEKPGAEFESEGAFPVKGSFNGNPPTILSYPLSRNTAGVEGGHTGMSIMVLAGVIGSGKTTLIKQ